LDDGRKSLRVNGIATDDPMLNVFVKDGDTMRHFWGSELVFALEDPGQNHRRLDFMDPVWGMLDTTPEGRDKEFFPNVDYGPADQAKTL
jgi:predicted dithiol-disulfide oxidoreductase (DUF899 family)